MASATTKKVFYIENISNVSHRQLAGHLVSGTERSWRCVKVAFLYNKMRGSQPLCAAVQVPSSMLKTCWNKSGSILFSGKLKMTTPEEFKHSQSVRWIGLADGSRVSVMGKKHWAVENLVQSQAGDAANGNRDVQRNGGFGGEIKSGFYAWDRVKLKGGKNFCYAAVDCGSSLADYEFRDDVDTVIGRAVEAGVQRLVLKGSSLNKAERAKQLASVYPDVIGFSVGYRPQLQQNEWTDDKLVALRDLASCSACVAVGECGLDLSSPLADYKCKQKPRLVDQLKLARELGKPALIYERDAKEKLLDILSEHKDNLPPLAVRSENPEADFVNHLTRNRHYVIVTGAWWYSKAQKLQSTHLHQWLKNADRQQLDYLLLASNAPLDFPNFITSVVIHPYQRMLQKMTLEYFPTVAKDLCAQWCRRKRNEPICVPVLIELIAHTTMIKTEEMADILLKNSQRFFKFVPRQEEQWVREDESVEDRWKNDVTDMEEKMSWKWEQTRFWLRWVVSVVILYYCAWYFCDFIGRFM